MCTCMCIGVWGRVRVLGRSAVGVWWESAGMFSPCFMFSRLPQAGSKREGKAESSPQASGSGEKRSGALSPSGQADGPLSEPQGHVCILPLPRSCRICTNAVPNASRQMQEGRGLSQLLPNISPAKPARSCSGRFGERRAGSRLPVQGIGSPALVAPAHFCSCS